MPVLRFPKARKVEPRRAPIKRNGRVYAIAFDIDTTAAEAIIGPSWRGCYEKISAVFAEHGFGRQQGSVYFGDETSDAVRCVMAVQALDRRYSWFGRVVRDLRMLRVDEDNDLMPALSSEQRLEGGAVGGGTP